jgi:monothiol glutaredoxin
MLSEAVRTQIDELVHKNRVVLFMKGNRSFPQCGFSQAVVGILNGYVPKYETFNVLSSPEVRDGIKEYSSWPTIPQLYIDGKFIGGCDIVKEMHQTGELAKLLGVEAPAPPKDDGKTTVKISDDAAKDILEAQKDADGDPLRLTIDARFDYDLFFDPKQPTDRVFEVAGVTLLLDPDSASRAGDLSIGSVPGKGFFVENSKAPPRVKPMTADVLKKLLETEPKRVVLLDVRPEGERNLASIPGHKPLDTTALESLESLASDVRVVLYCHHGHRSRAAAEQLLGRGLKNVYNLDGGIDAYAAVDSKIARY